LSADRVEHEAKIPVEELTSIERRLRELAAEFRGEQLQRDVLYDYADRSLTAKGEALRLRQTDSEATLTFKGAPTVGQFKVRPEFESGVADAEQIEAVLNGLGLTPHLSYMKTRNIYVYEGCEVCLDQVADLGTFVEIEGPDGPTIQRVCEALGLDPAAHEPRSYPQMVAALRK